MTRDRLAERIAARLPDFTGLDARVVFDLGEEGRISVDATLAPPQIDETIEQPDCTIKVAPADLDKLIDGALNPMLAFTLGKLKIEGSMGSAMKIAGRLDAE